MTFQPGSNLYTQGFGSRPENVEVPHYDVRAPATSDVLYPIGKRWIDTVGQNVYTLVAQSTSAGVTTSTWIAETTASGALSVTSLTTTTFVNAGTSVTAATTVSAGTSVTAGTSITATLGNITATNGNLVLGTAGNKISIATGANASVGTSAAMTAGAVTVANTSVTANSIIFAVPAALGTVTAPQAYYISAKVASTSFTITSADATDTSTWNYWIIN